MNAEQAHKEAKGAHIRAEIQRLDEEREDRLKGQYSGNKAQIRDQIGSNMQAEMEYQTKRALLVQKLEESNPLSPGVQEYIDSKNQKIESKFDVDDKTSVEDVSLNPLGGKAV